MRKQIVELVCQAASPDRAASARKLLSTRGNIIVELLELGFTPASILSACTEVTGIPTARAEWLRNPKSSKVDVDLCRRVNAAPVAVDGGWMCIAFSDPEIAVRAADLGFPPHQPYLAMPAQLQPALALLGAPPSARGPAAKQSRPDFDAPTTVVSPVNVDEDYVPDPDPSPNQSLDDPTSLESFDVQSAVNGGYDGDPYAAPVRETIAAPTHSATAPAASAPPAKPKAKSTAVIPGTTVPQLPGAQAPSRPPTFIPIAPMSPSSLPSPSSSPPSAPIIAPRATQNQQIEDVTGDVAFGIGTARGLEASSAGMRPAARPEESASAMRPALKPGVDVTGSGVPVPRRETSVPKEVPRRETSVPKEVPQRRETSVPKEVPQRRDSSAPKSVPASARDPDRSEGSQPKPAPSRRGGLTVESVSDLKLPEPKPLPLPPRVAPSAPSAPSASSAPSAPSTPSPRPDAATAGGSPPKVGAVLPTSGGTPQARKFEPLDPVVEAPKKKKEKKKEPKKGQPKGGADGEVLTAALQLVSGTDGPIEGTAAVAVELDGPKPSTRSAAKFGAVAVAVVVVAVAVAVVVQPFAPPAAPEVTAAEQVEIRQAELLTSVEGTADHAKAIVVLDEVIALDGKSLYARDALMERARRRIALSQLDQAKADLAALKGRPDAESIDALMQEASAQLLAATAQAQAPAPPPPIDPALLTPPTSPPSKGAPVPKKRR